MKRFPLFCLLATGVIGLHAETFIDNARVRSVDPQYKSASFRASSATASGSTKHGR